MTHPPSKVRRVLVYRLGSLGDTVISLPCLHLIARTYPQARRVLLTNTPVQAKAAPASAVIGSSGLIQGYMRYTMATRNPLELARLWWELVRFRPDVAIYLMPLRQKRALQRDLWFFRSAGIRNIIGLPGLNASSRVLDENTGLFEKEAFRLARTLDVLGDAHPEAPENWDLRLNASEKEAAGRALASLGGAPLILCAPGTKMQANDWGTEKWSLLMKRLSSAFPTHGLALLGAVQDRETGDAIAAGWTGQSVNLCGRLAPRETAAVMAQGEVFLGPDSGPMHLAAAVGVPVASPFSARHKPGVWFPAGAGHQIVYHQTDCFGCQLETCVERKKECIASITVDEMYHAVLRAFQSRVRQASSPVGSLT